MCLCITLCLQPPRTYCSCAASEFAKEDQNQPTRQTNKSLRATLLAFHILSHDVHKLGVLRSVRWASPFTSESVSKEVKTDGGGHHPWDPSPRITPASCSTSSILSHSLLATHPVGWSSLQVVFLPCPNYDLNAYFLPNKRVGKIKPMLTVLCPGIPASYWACLVSYEPPSTIEIYIYPSEPTWYKWRPSCFCLFLTFICTMARIYKTFTYTNTH